MVFISAVVCRLEKGRGVMAETKERSGIFKFFYIILTIITFPIFMLLFILRHPFWEILVKSIFQLKKEKRKQELLISLTPVFCII